MRLLIGTAGGLEVVEWKQVTGKNALRSIYQDPVDEWKGGRVDTDDRTRIEISYRKPRSCAE